MPDSPFYYVRDRGSRVAHHWDYARDRGSVALCGHKYIDDILSEGSERPRSVCRACQALTGPRQVAWLEEQRQRDEMDKRALLKQISELEDRVSKLRMKVENQRNQLARIQTSVPPRVPNPKKVAANNTPKKRKTSTRHRQPPRIRIVSGGLPGLGKRR